jgi:hypothetical protein
MIDPTDEWIINQKWEDKTAHKSGVGYLTLLNSQES